MATKIFVNLPVESRDQVNEMVGKAVAAGGRTYAGSTDHGFMYQYGFQDLDGHIWELISMEPDAIRRG